MFKPAVHQVAGHAAGAGKLGPLVDGSGRFYKPLQDGERGSREKKFYESFWTDDTIPDTVKSVFPFYYGTSQIEASDGSGLIDHVILEDLTYKYQLPSVIDIKMGEKTWYPGASDAYIAKCLEKDAQSTSQALGLRISGLQVHSKDGVTWKPGHNWCKTLDVDTTKVTLRRFVSSDPSSLHPDATLAPLVYGGPCGIINQLTELRKWFKTQRNYHFFSSSILLLYESCSDDAHPSVKMVDFAHVFTGPDGVDENFMKGLDSLLNILQEITPEF